MRENKFIDTFGTMSVEGKSKREELNDHLKELEAKLNDYQSRPDILSKEQTDLIVEKLREKEQTFFVMRDILEKIRASTNHFRDIIDMGLFDSLTNWDWGGKVVQGVPVKWEDKSVPHKGLFDVNFLKIRIKSHPPEPSDVVASLAKEGILPPPLRTLIHEFVHSLQLSWVNDPKQLMNLFKYYYFLFTRSQELEETHAKRSAGKTVDRTSQSELRERILTSGHDGKLQYDRVKSERLEYAIKAIDYLLALGISPEGIADLVKDHGGWDEKRGVYKKIAQRIEEESRKHGLSDSDLDKLVEVNRLEKKLDRYRAKEIAERELLKYQNLE